MFKLLIDILNTTEKYKKKKKYITLLKMTKEKYREPNQYTREKWITIIALYFLFSFS